MLSVLLFSLLAAAAAFVQPERIVVTSSIALDFDWLTIEPGFGGPQFQTRALGGSSPGPTIVVDAGTTLEVQFNNKLSQQATAVDSATTFNRYSDPDTANLHFHGLHVSSVRPGDDTTLAIGPGESFEYKIEIPEDHMPGLHWVHPHHHGASSLHLGGGAACALIVKDPEGYLPETVASAQEAVLVFQDWSVKALREIAKKAGDVRFGTNLDVIEGGLDIGQRFVTINGVWKPTLNLQIGRWYRWRMLYAGWLDLLLNFVFVTNDAQCEFQLLAKDGVYIADFPRELGSVPLPPGGRADIMVRCHQVGNSTFQAMSRNVLTVTAEDDGTVATSDATAPLQAWTPANRPEYLQDLSQTEPSPGCSCPTRMDGYDDTSTINGRPYRAGEYLHATYLGAIVERELSILSEHSYHQHIHPFQLTSGSWKPTEYVQPGDWHDTLLLPDPGIVITRFRTGQRYAGNMMVHCHNSMHADRGMLAKEFIRNATDDGACQCSVLGPIETEDSDAKSGDRYLSLSGMVAAIGFTIYIFI